MPVHARFPDGRLHLQHGPIDCVIEAWGEPAEVEAAYAQAWSHFQGLLEALVEELQVLRSPVVAAYPRVRGPVAKRMVAAVWPHRTVFITPMAAVAGAVAEELLEAMVLGRRLRKACVNNGGDIALHLERYAEFDVGIATRPDVPAVDGGLTILATEPVRGIATSGWRGRSQSLGIADAVTVLASTAAVADAAATLIANAVNVEHASIRRLPARAVKEDSDLGDLAVTVGVGPLPDEAVEAALDAGLGVARGLRGRGCIDDALLVLDGGFRAVRERPPFVIGASC